MCGMYGMRGMCGWWLFRSPFRPAAHATLQASKSWEIRILTLLNQAIKKMEVIPSGPLVMSK